ncbi:MAG: hypothetical protein KF690_06565 [Bacteroidetes bacterium]|nr:hypothetical protein [Bacteroidota bacterium]
MAKTRIRPAWQTEILFSLLCVLTYTLLQGYIVGLEDQLDYLPYSLYLSQPDLYSQDLFIQTLASQPVHERTVSAGLVSLFAPHLEAAMLGLHLLTACALAWGLLRVAQQYLGVNWRAYLTVLFTFTALQYVYWDATELLYNNWQGDTVAMTCGVWALWLADRRQYLRAAGLLALGTLFHPLVGLLWAIWLGLALLVTHRQYPWRSVMAAGIFYFLLAGWYIALLLYSKQTGAPPDPDHFARYYVFRAPHHFMPDSFSRKGWILLAMFIPLGIWRLRGMPRALILCFMVIACLYALCVGLLRHPAIVPLQWYRLSPVVEFLGAIAAASLLPAALPLKVSRILRHKGIWTGTGLLLMVLLAWWPAHTPRPYHYHPGNLATHPEVVLGRVMRQKLPAEALVLHPLRFGGHKYFGGCSSYLEYKSIPRTQAAFRTWYERLSRIYGKEALNHPDFWEQADSLYPARIPALQDSLPTWGITHVIMPAGQALSLPKVWETPHYVLYTVPSVIKKGEPVLPSSWFSE